MTLAEGLQIAASGATLGAIVYAAGKLAARFELFSAQLTAMRELLDERFSAQSEKFNDLRKEVETQRNDRHDLIGKVMLHTGKIGDIEKTQAEQARQISDVERDVDLHGRHINAIDARVASVEAKVSREFRS